LIKSSGQFSQGIDLKMLLNELFIKVQSVKDGHGGNEGEFFETIWNETSKLIKVIVIAIFNLFIYFYHFFRIVVKLIKVILLL
jgi:hypothetical protein